MVCQVNNETRGVRKHVEFQISNVAHHEKQDFHVFSERNRMSSMIIGCLLLDNNLRVNEVWHDVKRAKQRKITGRVSKKRKKRALFHESRLAIARAISCSINWAWGSHFINWQAEASSIHCWNIVFDLIWIRHEAWESKLFKILFLSSCRLLFHGVLVARQHDQWSGRVLSAHRH